MNRKKSFSEKVDEYISYRHNLGYSLHVEAGELRRFACYAERIGHHGPLTIELSLGWARSATNCTPLYQARRVEIVRTFARYLAAFEPGTQIPPRGLLGPAHRRSQPYIYSSEEILALMNAAAKLTPSGGLRPQTYKTLIGLLSSTGLRVCEALNLKRDEVDLSHHLLHVRRTKFYKSRLVPLHKSVGRALEAYAFKRDALHPAPLSNNFLLSERGTALLPSIVHYTFCKLRKTIAREDCSNTHPRLYDLRHTFACRRILKWYQDGIDVQHAITYLSTYLGHVKPTDTYWYLTGIPDLMAIAARRFERFGGAL
jgi:integrase